MPGATWIPSTSQSAADFNVRGPSSAVALLVLVSAGCWADFRVALFQKELPSALTINSESPFEVVDAATKQRRTIEPPQLLTLRRDNSRIIIDGGTWQEQQYV